MRLDWTGTSGPIVIVLPGLQGDLGSAYVRGLLRACQARGWRGVLLNYRGHIEPNRLPSSYHCGMTCDLDYLAQHLSEREPGTPLAVVGYSVGANICLKWLGECGQRGQSLPVVAAVGISAPFHLGVVAKKIERGFSRVYQWYLLGSLRRDVVRKMAARGDDLGITRRELRRLNTFFKFDDRISGPWHGFRGAEDYYAKTRSDVLLKHVAVPTLIVNARNDPLVPAHLIPHPRHLGPGEAGDYRWRRPSRFCQRPLALVAAFLAGDARAGISRLVLAGRRFAGCHAGITRAVFHETSAAAHDCAGFAENGDWLRCPMGEETALPGGISETPRRDFPTRRVPLALPVLWADRRSRASRAATAGSTGRASGTHPAINARPNNGGLVMKTSQRALVLAAILVVATFTQAKASAVVHASLQWLARHQNADGRWQFDPPAGAKKATPIPAHGNRTPARPRWPCCHSSASAKRTRAEGRTKPRSPPPSTG